MMGVVSRGRWALALGGVLAAVPASAQVVARGGPYTLSEGSPLATDISAALEGLPLSWDADPTDAYRALAFSCDAEPSPARQTALRDVLAALSSENPAPTQRLEASGLSPDSKVMRSIELHREILAQHAASNPILASALQANAEKPPPPVHPLVKLEEHATEIMLSLPKRDWDSVSPLPYSLKDNYELQSELVRAIGTIPLGAEADPAPAFEALSQGYRNESDPWRKAALAHVLQAISGDALGWGALTMAGMPNDSALNDRIRKTYESLRRHASTHNNLAEAMKNIWEEAWEMEIGLGSRPSRPLTDEEAAIRVIKEAAATPHPVLGPGRTRREQLWEFDSARVRLENIAGFVYSHQAYMDSGETAKYLHGAIEHYGKLRSSGALDSNRDRDAWRAMSKAYGALRYLAEKARDRERESQTAAAQVEAAAPVPGGRKLRLRNLVTPLAFLALSIFGFLEFWFGNVALGIAAAISFVIFLEDGLEYVGNMRAARSPAVEPSHVRIDPAVMEEVERAAAPLEARWPAELEPEPEAGSARVAQQ